MPFQIRGTIKIRTLKEGLAASPFGRINLSWDPDTNVLYHLAFAQDLLGHSFFPQTPFEISHSAAQDIVDLLLSSGTHPFLAIGSPYQIKVWERLCNSLPGQTTTYSGLATQLGEPQSARAVARAVATNPLSWIIPCHRVLPKSGGIGQYRWGATVKEALLKHEQAPTKT